MNNKIKSVIKDIINENLPESYDKFLNLNKCISYLLFCIIRNRSTTESNIESNNEFKEYSCLNIIENGYLNGINECINILNTFGFYYNYDDGFYYNNYDDEYISNNNDEITITNIENINMYIEEQISIKTKYSIDNYNKLKSNILNAYECIVKIKNDIINNNDIESSIIINEEALNKAGYLQSITSVIDLFEENNLDK